MTTIYLIAVGLSYLFFIGWTLRDRPKKPPPEPAEKPKEPPRWHDGFDHPV